MNYVSIIWQWYIDFLIEDPLIAIGLVVWIVGLIYYTIRAAITGKCFNE